MSPLRVLTTTWPTSLTCRPRRELLPHWKSTTCRRDQRASFLWQLKKTTFNFEGIEFWAIWRLPFNPRRSLNVYMMVMSPSPGQADTWTLLPSLRSPLCGSVPVLKVGVHGDQFWKKVCCCFLPVGISEYHHLKLESHIMFTIYIHILLWCFVFCYVVPYFWFDWQSQNRNMKRYATYATYATCDMLKSIFVRSLETRFLALEALLDEYGKVDRTCKRRCIHGLWSVFVAYADF